MSNTTIDQDDKKNVEGRQPEPLYNDPESHPGDTYEEIIQAENIHKTYLLGVEGVAALRGVTLRIRRGEFVVILGKSGGGKTSLLNVIGTIDKPTKGALTICGSRITANTKDSEFAQLRLEKIGFVFQTFNLISTMTALENVSLPMILHGKLSKKDIRARAGELLKHFGLGERLDHLPSQLSGGEQQRVTIARAIANAPDILLLDEPTGDLDTATSHLILQHLVNLNRVKGITLVMVTHDNALKNYAHRVVHIMDGKIVKMEEISAKCRESMDRSLVEMRKQEALETDTQKEVQKEFRKANHYKFTAVRNYKGQNYDM